MTGWTSSTKFAAYNAMASAQSLVIPTEFQGGQHDQTRVRFGSKLMQNNASIRERFQMFFLQVFFVYRLNLWMFVLKRRTVPQFHFCDRYPAKLLQ